MTTGVESIVHGHASWTNVLIESDVMLLQQADDAIEWLTVCRPGAVIEPALAVLRRGMRVVLMAAWFGRLRCCKRPRLWWRTVCSREPYPWSQPATLHAVQGRGILCIRGR